MKTEWKGRTILPENAVYVLDTGLKMLPNDVENVSFVDFGSGTGTIFELLEKYTYSKNVVSISGVEFVKEFAEESKKYTKNIIQKDLMLFDDNDIKMLSSFMQGRPTLGFCYDGGIFPFSVLEQIAAISAVVLPAGSVFVFVTAIADGPYNAIDLIVMMQKMGRFFFKGAVHYLREDETQEEPSMQALYFAAEGRDVTNFLQDGTLSSQPQADTYDTSLKLVPLKSLHKCS